MPTYLPYICRKLYLEKFLTLAATRSLPLPASELDPAPLKEALGELGVDSFESGGEGGAAGSGAQVLDFLVDPGVYRDVEEVVRTVAE